SAGTGAARARARRVRAASQQIAAAVSGGTLVDVDTARRRCAARVTGLDNAGRAASITAVHVAVIAGLAEVDLTIAARRDLTRESATARFVRDEVWHSRAGGDSWTGLGTGGRRDREPIDVNDRTTGADARAVNVIG